jgi:DNA modification methylase
MEGYKEITIHVGHSLKETEQQAILDLRSSFKSNGLKIEFNDQEIKVLLKEINYFEFKDLIEKINHKYNTSVLDNILEKIDSIKNYGIKGNKRNYVDFNKERKVKDRKQKEEKREQYYYSKNAEFSSNNNLLPEKFINQIICGDSENVLSELPDNCIDIIFTSPPYNFGLEYSSTNDDYYWENYFDKLFKIFDQCIRVLKYGGRIIVNIQPLFSDYIPSHHIISNFFISKKLIWKGEILWEKNNYNCKYTAWGSWESPSNPYLKYTWEFLEIFCKGTLKKEGIKENIDITAEEFKQWVVAKWSIAPERDMKKWGHPAMFPEKLVERTLKLFSYKNDIVLDPFNGVGTTTAVAKRLNRKYIGIDISKEYCDIARKRVDNTSVEVKLF